MDLVPDDVLSSHILPLLSFRDAFRLYSSCGRFRRLLSVRMVPRLEVLVGPPEGVFWDGLLPINSVRRRAVMWGFLDLVRFLVGEKGFCDWTLGIVYAAEGGNRDLVEYFAGMGDSGWEWGMQCAASAGRWDLVDFCVDRGGLSYQRAMTYVACRGDWKLFEYLQRKLE